ncbi:R-spondin-1-like [Glandiceps talaboti]
MKASQLLYVGLFLSITSVTFGGRSKIKGLHRILCPSPCGRCAANPLKGCRSCNANAHLFMMWGTHGICLGNCPIGYYSHHHVCTECQLYKCASCIDGRRCRRCVFPAKLHDEQCLEECPYGTEEIRYRGFGSICQEEAPNEIDIQLVDQGVDLDLALGDETQE